MAKKLYSNKLTVIVRDDCPMIYCGDSPSYRTVNIELTPEQMAQLGVGKLMDYEEISRCIIEEQERLPIPEVAARKVKE